MDIRKMLMENGELSEVIPEERYYWISEKDEGKLAEFISGFEGVKVAKLQGILLK